MEDAENQLRGKIEDEAFFKNLESAQWKDKVASLQWLGEHMEVVDENLEAVLRYVGKKLKDWKESTLKVVNEVFALVTLLNELEPSPYSKRSFLLMLPLLLEKIGDAKYNEAIEKTLLRHVQWVFPKFVVGQFLAAVAKDAKKNTLKTV